MATRSEEARAERERANAKKSPGAKKRAKKRVLAARHARPASHESTHANRKATVVLEDHAEGARPSRKSTRKASNRSKATSTLDIREELVKGAPSRVRR